MFFRRRPKTSEEPVTKRGIKKMDAVVTGAILGGIVASLYGVKKLQRDSKEKDAQDSQNKTPQLTPAPKKPGFFRRLFGFK